MNEKSCCDPFLRIEIGSKLSIVESITILIQIIELTYRIWVDTRTTPVLSECTLNFEFILCTASVRINVIHTLERYKY